MTDSFVFVVDSVTQTARFAETEDLLARNFYRSTSLLNCNCADFRKRNLPCKHIYRLAVELGVIEIIRRSTIPTINKEVRAFITSKRRELLDEVKSSENINDHPEQRKRITTAENKKMAPISVDYVSQTALFKGSAKKPYETTVDSCTCRDYFVRRLPCKHMYRLYMELQKHKEIERWEDLYKLGQIDFDTYTRVRAVLSKEEDIVTELPDNAPALAPEEERYFHPSEEIERWKNLYEEGHMDFDTYRRVCVVLLGMES